MNVVYLAVRASRERVAELLRAYGVGGRALRQTASGWSGLVVDNDGPEGVIGPLLAQELGDVITVHETVAGREVIVRGALGTERFRATPDATDPTAVAARLQSLSGRPVDRGLLERTLLEEPSDVALIRSLAAQLDLPDAVTVPDRQVVAYDGQAAAVRAWAMSTSPVLLAPPADGWQLVVPHPSAFCAGERLAAVLIHGPFATQGERALVVGRYDAARSVTLGGDVALGELVSASWEWDPLTVEVPPPDPRPVAMKLAHAFPGSDVEVIEQALTTSDADRGLTDLVAALGVTREAVDVLELPVEELLERSEGVGLGSRHDVARQLLASGAQPKRARGPVLRWTDRALGLTTSVIGALMILVALALFVLGVTLEGEGLLPRNPWGLLVVGAALTYLGRRQHRRGTT